MLVEILRPAVLVPWLLGMVFGVFVGATPGLTATMAVAERVKPIAQQGPCEKINKEIMRKAGIICSVRIRPGAVVRF